MSSRKSLFCWYSRSRRSASSRCLETAMDSSRSSWMFESSERSRRLTMSKSVSREILMASTWSAIRLSTVAMDERRSLISGWPSLSSRSFSLSVTSSSLRSWTRLCTVGSCSTSAKVAYDRFSLPRRLRRALILVSIRMRSALAWAYSVVRVLSCSEMTFWSSSAKSTASSRSRYCIRLASASITCCCSGAIRSWITS